MSRLWDFFFGKEKQMTPQPQPQQPTPPTVIPNEMTEALVQQTLKLNRRSWEIRQELAKGALGLVAGNRK